MARRRGPQPGWKSKVPHGNGKNPHLIEPGLRNHFVYLMFNGCDEVIYVGCTRRPEQRWREHQGDNRNMVAQVTRKKMIGPYDYPTARRIERELQFKYRPPNGRKFWLSRAALLAQKTPA